MVSGTALAEQVQQLVCQQLADYLGVDRSAMSNELSKMQRDGLISYKRSEFTLHEAADAD